MSIFLWVTIVGSLVLSSVKNQEEPFGERIVRIILFWVGALGIHWAATGTLMIGSSEEYVPKCQCVQIEQKIQVK